MSETESAKEAPKAEEVKSEVNPTPEQKVEAKLYPEKKEEVKPETKQPDKVESKVPEKYELKKPEGSMLSDGVIEKISEYAKQKGFSNEDAQNLLNMESEAIVAFVDGQKQVQEARATAWVEDVKKDKELGGEAFVKNAEIAKRVIDKFASPTLKEELNKTGLGNYPELVRFVVRIGKAMSEDSLIRAGMEPAQKRSIEDIFYGGSKTKE